MTTDNHMTMAAIIRSLKSAVDQLNDDVIYKNAKAAIDRLVQQQVEGMQRNEVLMQLFVDGPTWDGNLISKADRTELVIAGLADATNGWNFLTEDGVTIAVAAGLNTREWADTRWYRKASNQ